MRIVFVGGGEVTARTAQTLIERGNQVIIVEKDEGKIKELSETLDCSFLHGDGTKPHILKEVGPRQTDVLLCLTDVDQMNLIASLVGKSLGFERIVTSIQDPEFEDICWDLGLEDTIVPSRTISRYLADMVSGHGFMELASVIKGEARFFSFTAEDEDAKRVEELDLPKGAGVICLYRGGTFMLTQESTKIRSGDEVVILTHSKNLSDLKKRWSPMDNNQNQESAT